MRHYRIRFAPLAALAMGLFLLHASHAAASLIASDDASDAAYNDGWGTGDNGGTGFQAWSTINNAMDPTGYGGGFIATGNTDIGTGVSNKAFGVFGNDGGVGQAIRPFNGSLTVGQSFSISMDNGNIDTGGTVGFGLQNSSSENRLEFYFVGGQTTYKVNGSSEVDSGVGFTSSGLNLVFTLTGADSYSFTINGGTPITGSMGGTTGTGIDRLRLFNANGGADVFFNSMSIVPEPSSLAMLLIGTLGLGILRRRHSA